MSIDRKSKLIKKYETTSANVHDSNVLEDLCDSNEPVFDDSAYVRKKVPEGCQHHTCRRSFRNKPLTDLNKHINRYISRIRSCVEHVFGFIETTMKRSTFNPHLFLHCLFLGINIYMNKIYKLLEPHEQRD